jgi:23S rRNA pseudouridine1911/1915/1917 synthase
MIKVLHFDKQIIVCEKPAGILSQADSSGAKNLPEILKKETNSYYVEAVHRLDKPVGGVMVYARQREAAGILSEAVKAHKMQKVYLAVVHGEPKEPAGIMKDFLYRDAKHCKSYVVKRERKGVKFASLEYKVLSTAEHPEHGKISLVLIKLHTGRTHQVRVQFASRKMPLLGDGKYGSRDNHCETALWSRRLAFKHPITGEAVEVVSMPPAEYPWNLFDIENLI